MEERWKLLTKVAGELAAGNDASYEFVQVPEMDANGDAYELTAFPDLLVTYPDFFTSAEVVDIAKQMMYKAINPRNQPYVLGYCPSSITLVKP